MFVWVLLVFGCVFVLLWVVEYVLDFDGLLFAVDGCVMFGLVWVVVIWCFGDLPWAEFSGLGLCGVCCLC